MNKDLYRLVWSRKLGLFQVASELARRAAKSDAQVVTSAPSTKSCFVVRVSLLTAATLMALGMTNPAWSDNWEAFSGSPGEVGAAGENRRRASGSDKGEKGGDGGNGTAGKDGVSLSDRVYVNSGSITGGAGGHGGAGGEGGMGGVYRGATSTMGISGGIGGNGGDGGNGGNGVSLKMNNLTYINRGVTSGGNRGQAGAGGEGGQGGTWDIPQAASGEAGKAGVGGYGIFVSGTNSHIINEGSLAPGAGQTVAIMYNSGASNARLELQKGTDISGIVDANAATGKKILALGANNTGDQGTFNVDQLGAKYLGFNALEKTGAGSWELTGSSTASTPWTIYDGTLRVRADNALGASSNPLTFGAAGVKAGTTDSEGTGRLEVLNSLSTARPFVLNGNGRIVHGSNTLTSTGTISGSGTLTADGAGGALKFSGRASRQSGGLALSSGVLDFEAGARFAVTNAYAQANAGTLRVNMDTDAAPIIAAGRAQLDGILTINNYTILGKPLIASQLASADRILITTTAGIDGDFSNAPKDEIIAGYDYLRVSGQHRGNNYVMGLGLAWDAERLPNGDFTLNNGDFTVDQVLANRADDGSTLSKQGADTLTLSAQNTYTGSTTVNAGRLALNEDGDISNSSALIINADANVDVSGVSSGSTQVNNLSGTAASTIQLGKTALTVVTSTDVEFAGQIQGRGDLIKSGDHALALSQAQAYTGATKVAGGTLRAEAENILNSSSGLELKDGATFQMNDLSQSVAQIHASDTSGTIDLGNATLTLTGNGASTASYAGTITGTGELVKDGSYTQYLSGTQAIGHTGTTTIKAGVLALSNFSDHSLSKPIVLNGGWLDLSDSTDFKDWSGLVIHAEGADGKGGVIGHGDVIHLEDGVFNAVIGGAAADGKDGVYVVKDTEGETILSGAGNTYVGNTRIKAGILTVTSDALLGDTKINREVILSGGILRVDGSYDSQRALQLAADGTVDVTSDHTITWHGRVSGTTGTTEYGLTKTGSGTLVLSGSNDYQGDTTIAQGTLALKDKADLKDGNLVFSSVAANAIVDLSGLEEGRAHIGKLVDNGSDSIIALGASTLEIKGGGEFNGILQDEALSGESGGSILKSGNNVFTLSGANTYTGVTTVADGVLALSGAASLANSSNVNLTSAAAVLDISATDAGTDINNLTGVHGSQVALGTQTLVINQTEETLFAGDISGTGSVEKTGSDTLTLKGNLTYSGDTILTQGKLVLDGADGGGQLIGNVNGKSGASLSLQNGASLTGAIDPVDVAIDAASRWNMTASSNVERMDLAGAIDFVAPTVPMTSGRTLTASHWVGQGGTVKLYAVLGNDATISDQLVIDGGSANGNTTLRIINAGGLGAQTTGDGIKVVDAINDASTDDTAFDLSDKLFAGVYEYNLKRGGAVDEHDWFLVSKTRSETSLYSALGKQGSRYGETVLGSLQERMGALEQLVKKNDTHVWGRLFGQVDSRAATTRSIGQEVDTRGMQVGSDVYVKSRGAGRDSLGVYLASGQSTARAEHDDGGVIDFAGKNTIRAYSVGAYFTRLDGAGAYLDTVLQASRYEIDSQSVNNVKTSTDAIGLLGSIEIGKGFDLGGGRKLEPQAQVVVQRINMSEFGIDNGATAVNVDSGTNVTSRAGLRLSKTDFSDSERPASVWLALDMLNTSGSNTTTTFSTPGAADMEYADQLSGTRVKLSAGADDEIGKNLRLNFRVSAETSVDASRQKGFGITLGLKYAF